MSIGELWVQSAIFPWLLIILASWVGASTILMWRMWYRIEDIKKYNRLLQELMMGGIRGVREQIQDNQANQGRKRSKSKRRRSKERYAGQLRSKGRSIRSEEPESTNSEENGEDSHLEVASTIEIQTDEGTECRDKTTAKTH